MPVGCATAAAVRIPPDEHRDHEVCQDKDDTGDDQRRVEESIDLHAMHGCHGQHPPAAPGDEETAHAANDDEDNNQGGEQSTHAALAGRRWDFGHSGKVALGRTARSDVVPAVLIGFWWGGLLRYDCP